MISEVGIREFQPGDEEAFRQLNEEWIAHYFRIEPKDKKTLGDPGKTILEPGGRIFFATVEGQCIGCCALVRMSEDEFEVAKMAVTPKYQSAGIGRKLLASVVEAARAAGVRRLYIETNHSLTPAIRLYASLGFVHLPAERVTPSPYERADVFMEMLLR